MSVLDPPSDLSILCVHQPGFALTIDRSFPINGGQSLAVETVDMADPGNATRVHLDRENARRLFNWLGVWLHKPDPVKS